MCLAAVQPRDFAASTEDGEYETTFRCRKCPGCRAYDALILRRRLAIYFDNIDAPVWLVEFSAEQRDPAGISAAVVRAGKREFLPGYILVDANRIAKIRVGSKPKALKLDRLKISQHKPRLIAHPDRKRAWKRAVRGMRRARSEIGDNRNRFYLPSMPQLPKTAFIKQLQGGIRKRHPEAKQGVRAWKQGLSLYPSEVQQGKEVLAALLARKSSRGNGFKLNARLPKAISSLLTLPQNSSRPATSSTPIQTKLFFSLGDASSTTKPRKELQEALDSLLAKIQAREKT